LWLLNFIRMVLHWSDRSVQCSWSIGVVLLLTSSLGEKKKLASSFWMVVCSSFFFELRRRTGRSGIVPAQFVLLLNSVLEVFTTSFARLTVRWIA
jgi:hypothetical protein